MQFLRNLPIGRKFLILGLLMLALCLPPVGLVLQGALQTMADARAERDGVKPVGALLQLLRETQVHRGATAGWLGGNEGMKDRRSAQAGAVDKALAGLVEASAVYKDGAVGQHRGTVQQQWQALREDVAARRIDGPTSFARHTALINLQLRLLDDVADRAGLMLDPDPGAYYLISVVVETLPAVSELLGQSRALGALYLARQAASPAERVRLEALLTQLAQRNDDLERAFSNVAENSPALAASLDGPRRATAEALATATKLVQAQVVTPDKLEAPASDYFNAMTSHIDSLFKLTDASFAVLSTQLQVRVQQQQWRLAAMGAALLMLGSLAAALMLVIARGTVRTVASAQAAAEALARGDLSHAVQVESDDEIGRMARTLGDAMGELGRLVREIKATGESVGTASAQIAAGNNDLSSRTEQTSANLQNTASAMEELHATVRNNADAARQAAALAGQSSQVAADGGSLVGQVVETMQAISQRSDKIADIIGVIDGIAFQTNILALNAAVEAARAGEQGRGFAVVASEVRALAQRSAAAAREIKGLIQASVETVHAGTALVSQAQTTMQDILHQVQQVSTLVGEIGTATAEQSEGIAQVNTTVGQLDQATQQNAALVEESAAAADSLQQQASTLVAAVGRFRL
jgi:methyl-accepting chemotaxis protein